METYNLTLELVQRFKKWEWLKSATISVPHYRRVLVIAMVANAALLKAKSMAAFGIFVLTLIGYRLFTGATPDPFSMGLIGVLALSTNVGVALMLYRWCEADANMRSVWLCSRNDTIGNLLVIGAALAVNATQTSWPDLLIASVMAVLALQGASAVIREARRELRNAPFSATVPR
jgi:Co/Zn/Cd efflux system component